MTSKDQRPRKGRGKKPRKKNNAASDAFLPLLPGQTTAATCGSSSRTPKPPIEAKRSRGNPALAGVHKQMRLRDSGLNLGTRMEQAFEECHHAAAYAYTHSQASFVFNRLTYSHTYTTKAIQWPHLAPHLASQLQILCFGSSCSILVAVGRVGLGFVSFADGALRSALV